MGQVTQYDDFQGIVGQYAGAATHQATTLSRWTQGSECCWWWQHRHQLHRHVRGNSARQYPSYSGPRRHIPGWLTTPLPRVSRMQEASGMTGISPEQVECTPCCLVTSQSRGPPGVLRQLSNKHIGHYLGARHKRENCWRLHHESNESSSHWLNDHSTHSCLHSLNCSSDSWLPWTLPLEPSLALFATTNSYPTSSMWNFGLDLDYAFLIGSLLQVLPAKSA